LQEHCLKYIFILPPWVHGRSAGNKEGDLDVPLLDTTRIHIDAVLDFMLA